MLMLRPLRMMKYWDVLPHFVMLLKSTLSIPVAASVCGTGKRPTGAPPRLQGALPLLRPLCGLCLHLGRWRLPLLLLRGKPRSHFSCLSLELRILLL